MLRVTPDGAAVWVQTAGANTNVALAVDGMETVWSGPTGRGPVQSAFGPAGGRYGLITHLEETYVLALDRETGREAGRIEVGGPQANVSFMPDGAMAFVTVTSRDEIAVIDMAELAVVGRIPTGGEPMGLVVFDPATA